MENKSIWDKCLSNKEVNNEQKPKVLYKELFKDIAFIFSIGAIYMLLQHQSKNRNKRLEERVRFFNPVIKRNWCGDEYIEWVGKDKPLTDEELSKIL